MTTTVLVVRGWMVEVRVTVDEGLEHVDILSFDLAAMV